VKSFPDRWFAVVPQLADQSLDQLRERLDVLDAWALAQELGVEGVDELRAQVFATGGTPEDAWNDYHQVRNEYDRRASEQFDLGQ
jgi:hypothetical protein